MQTIEHMRTLSAAVADSGNRDLENRINETADELYGETAGELVDFLSGLGQDMLVRESYRREAAELIPQLDEIISRIAVLKVNGKW